MFSCSIGGGEGGGGGEYKGEEELKVLNRVLISNY
jgi:hypothetical protein